MDNRHEYIRRQIIFDEMEEEQEKEAKEGKEDASASVRGGGAKGVRLLDDDDEGWS